MLPVKPLRFERYVLNPLTGRVHDGQGLLDLRPKTFEVLHHLLRRAGQIVTKSEVFAAVWPDVVVTDDSLVQCVCEIRRALGDERQEIVRTVPGRGYMFTEPVAELDTQEAPVTSRPIVDLPLFSVVVLPCKNLSGNRRLDPFLEQVTADLTFDISRIPHSFVIARNTAGAYKDKSVDPKQVGRELRVRYVVEGALVLTGNRARLELVLVDAVTGQQLWVERLDEHERDIADLYQETKGKIAYSLHLQFIEAAAEVSRRERPHDPSAADLVVRGMALIEHQTPQAIAQARNLAQEAIRRDADSTHAWQLLALTYSSDIYNRWHLLRGSRGDWIKRCNLAAGKAYAVDPNNFYAIGAWAWGLLVRADPEEATTCPLRQLAINPNYAQAYHQLATLKMLQGRPDQAIAAGREVLRLNRGGNLVHQAYGMISVALIHSGRYSDAQAAAHEAIKARTDYGNAWAHLAAACANLGDKRRAGLALAEFRRLIPYYTLATFREEKLSSAHAFVAQRERYYEGLHKAGLEE